MRRLLSIMGILLMIPFCHIHAKDNVKNSTEPVVILLLGPPGSGKGTQAGKIAARCRIPHISSGDLFRENIRNRTSLGQKAQSYIDAGNLVPDEITLEMIRLRVQQPDAEQGYLLDGVPRTVHQAQVLDSWVEREGSALIVLHLDVDDETLVKRLSGRRLCRSCPHIHHIEHQPPAVEGICDACGGELYQRSDDQPKVIRERLRVYHEQTKPVVAHYRAKGLLHTINGNQPPQQVFSDLIRHVQCPS